MDVSAQKWIVGVSGASGMKYAIRLLEVLSLSVAEVHVVFSEAALRVLREEEEKTLSPSKLSAEELFGEPRSNLYFYNPRDIGAVIASGSALFEGMVIIPSSMATVGAIAQGYGSTLLHRAADVTLKEGRKLLIVPRETPLSRIHLKNLLTLAEAGAVVIPAMPGFYHQPATINDLVDMMVMKVLDQMKIPNTLSTRWRSEDAAGSTPGAGIVSSVK